MGKKISLKLPTNPCIDCQERQLLIEKGVYGCSGFCLAYENHWNKMRERKEIQKEHINEEREVRNSIIDIVRPQRKLLKER